MSTVKRKRRDSGYKEVTNQKKGKIRPEEAKIIFMGNEDFEQIEREAALINNGLREDGGNQNGLAVEDQTMDSEYETDTEEVLREIYEFCASPRRSDDTKETRMANYDQYSEQCNYQECVIKLARMTISMMEKRDINEALDRYKIARIQYMPGEQDTRVDEVVVAVAPLPTNLKIK